MDYAAATPVSKRTSDAQLQAMRVFANPGAIHRDATEASRLLEYARKKIALFLGCKSQEIIFTSGGTESNNLSILGAVRAIENEGGNLEDFHYITTRIEHPSVLECFKEIERRGGAVTYLEPNTQGVITPDILHDAVTDKTALVSIGGANGEIGVVQPLHALSKVIKEKNQNSIFHTDAGQAPLYFPSIVHGLGVDVMTLDSGKLYGPRGVGAVYKKTSVKMSPTLHGGAQESGLRPGSENVALAAGFAEAVVEVGEKREKESKRIEQLRNFFIEELQSEMRGVQINGSGKSMLPNVVNVSIPEIDNEYITLALDNAGISLSTKSSCLEGEEDISRVVEALGGEGWRAKNALRFSFGSTTTKKEVAYAVKETKRVVEEFRNLT